MILLLILGVLMLILVVSAVLSFTAKDKRLRQNARFVAWLFLGTFTSILVALYVACRVIIGPLPPTLSELQSSFPKQRPDLETILRMSDEDTGFSRIAPDFLDQDGANGRKEGRYMAGDALAALPAARWDEYRRLYKHNSIRLGIQRNSAGDAFVMVQSVGLLNNGDISGYLYCNPIARITEPNVFRFEPCTSTKTADSHPFTGEHGDEGYSFRKLADHWYAYDQGPS